MSSTPDEALARHDSTRVENVTEADRALVLALCAWADDGRQTVEEHGRAGRAHDLNLRYGQWLEPGWAARLASALDGGLPEPALGDASRALERLQRMHSASARVALDAVHPSWLIRALKEESPAVQRIVVASFPARTRHRLQGELLLDSEDLKSDRAAEPACREWALGLWTERLVGGEPSRRDDPPAIIAMTRLSARVGYGLCRAAGFAKMSLAGQPVRKGLSGPEPRARWEWLRGRLEAADAEFGDQVRRDVQSVVAAKVPSRFHAARLGLVTFARLLADFEPFRLRWALQHWPYPIAKLLRALLADAAKQPPTVLRGELVVLKTAWDRLTLDGRIAMAWPDSHEDPTGAS
jgi:hypothetical protein